MGETPTDEAAERDEFGERQHATAYRPDDIEESLVLESSYLTKWLYDRYGEALRSVIVYDGAVSQYTYFANEVAESYDDAELDRIAEETAFRDALTDPHYESLFHLGNTEATVTFFEDGTLVQVPFGDTTGVVVTVDRECAVEVTSLVEGVRGDHRPAFADE